MLSFPKDTKHEQKCYVTHGTMGHLDPKQTPVKRKPFVNILGHKFINKVEMILPKELYEIMKSGVDGVLGEDSPVYSRVVLPLSALLEGEFFTEYIKKGEAREGIARLLFAYGILGNIMMLSKGMMGVDNVFSLSEGILTLHLDKETYERSGLVGKPEGIKGKREHRPRWIVEINLRLPSMLHGKKGFRRIEYAFKNVLTTPVTWLFCDLGATVLPSDPLSPHHPHKIACIPKVSSDLTVKRPRFEPPVENNKNYDEDFRDFASEIHEWLSLISLESPRVNSTDKIDPFLSRYDPPIGSDEAKELVKVTWTGFISSTWAHNTFIQALLVAPRNSWFSYYVGGFSDSWNGESKNCTVLKLPDVPNDYVLWEVE
ncbi:putative ribonuclease p 40kda subunit protein [Botrytis fragariae]|uniref:Putative ribonuclease p 40kda subunit protein n=1 Tax=Botrytis fragariae TaxID=1964551 RepID=A0A8H6EFJ7_9HELO|nr:putative ribonuclease p 40kda subunit protein [Botrytis fragariae]KAF5870060.1 putative ribonuclease p 40kda subunit protein [Botrytis fragariae]